MTDLAVLEIKADSRQVRTAGTDLNRMSTASTGLTRSMRALLPALTAVLSVRAFSRMAKEAVEFGAAIGEVSTLLDDMDQLPRITQESKNLAREFGGTPTAQAKAFYQAISAGAEDAEAATKILTVANKLAIGGVTDITTATDGLTTIVNAFALEASGATDVADAMFIAMKAGKTTIGELSGSIGRLAPVAAAAGLSFDEMLAAVSTLTTQGISTRESMAGMKAAISNILKPSQDATEEANKLGIAFNLQALQAQGLQGFMQGLIEKTGGSKESIVKLFGSVEALNAVFALTSAGGETFNNIMADMETKAGAAETATSKMMEGIDFKLTQLEGRYATARVEVGEFFLVMLEPHIDALNANFDAYVLGFKNFGFDVRDASLTIAEVWSIWGDSMAGDMDDVKMASQAFLWEMEQQNLTSVRGIVKTWGIGMVSLNDLVKRSTVETMSFFSKMQLWRNRDRMSALQWATKNAALNKVLEDSLSDLDEETMANFDSLNLLQSQLDDSREALIQTAGAADTATAAFGELNDANYQTWVNSQVVNDTISVGVTKFSALNEVLNPLNLNLMEMATSTLPEFRVAGMRTGEVTRDMTFELESQKRMLESIQQEWGTLIYDLFSDGNAHDIGDFFDTIAKGFLRMVADMAAADLANAVFGGGGLGALTNGNLTNMITGGGDGGGFGGAGGSLLSAGINATGTALTAGAGSFSLGAVGTTTGGWVAPSMVAPAAAGAGTGGIGATLTAGLSAIPVWGWALLAAGAAAAVLNNDDGKVRQNAGFTVGPTPSLAGSDRAFNVDAFSSGLKVTGFARRTDKAKAVEVIDTFRDIDLAMSDMIATLGGTMDLSRATLAGLDQEATPGSSGTFLGLGGNGGLGGDIDGQINMFVKQLTNHVGGLDETILQQIRTAKSSDEVFSILAGEIALLDDSNADLVDSNKALADSTKALANIFRVSESSPDRLTGQSFADTSLSQGAQDFFGASGESISFAEQQRRERVMRNIERVSNGYNPLTGKYDELPMASHSSPGLLKPDGSFAGGISSVPYDGMIAELHRGERVMTASQNAIEMGKTGMSVNNENQQLFTAMLGFLRKSNKTLDSLDQNGIRTRV